MYIKRSPLEILVADRTTKTMRNPSARMPARNMVNHASTFMAPFEHIARHEGHTPVGGCSQTVFASPLCLQPVLWDSLSQLGPTLGLCGVPDHGCEGQ